LLVGAVPAAAASPAPKTTAGVIAADDAWLQAEMKGDADALDALLTTEYRSIDANGKVITKQELVDAARKRGEDPKLAVAVKKWKAGHPSHAEVTLVGDVAVLRWTLEGAQAGKISSCDTFIYSDGRWRAVYSQHTTAAE